LTSPAQQGALGTNVYYFGFHRELVRVAGLAGRGLAVMVDARRWRAAAFRSGVRLGSPPLLAEAYMGRRRTSTCCGCSRRSRFSLAGAC